MEEMAHRVGKSIYFTHLFTELVKGKDEKTTFTSLLKLNVSDYLSDLFVRTQFFSK